MSLPNPFEVKPNCGCFFSSCTSVLSAWSRLAITQASVQLQLARDEANSLGIEGLRAHADITPTVLVSMGIDLEEQQ